jgi:hypothetical protein
MVLADAQFADGLGVLGHAKGKETAPAAKAGREFRRSRQRQILRTRVNLNRRHIQPEFRLHLHQQHPADAPRLGKRRQGEAYPQPRAPLPRLQMHGGVRQMHVHASTCALKGHSDLAGLWLAKGLIQRPFQRGLGLAAGERDRAHLFRAAARQVGVVRGVKEIAPKIALNVWHAKARQHPRAIHGRGKRHGPADDGGGHLVPRGLLPKRHAPARRGVLLARRGKGIAPGLLEDGQVQPVLLGGAVDKVVNAVAAGVASGGNGGPCHRRLRRRGGAHR